MNLRPMLAALAAVMLASVAHAEDAPICTDRPTKANAVCTVPAGKVQIETSAIGWNLTEVAGTRSELVTLGSSFAKLGLSANSDLQIGFTPLAWLTIKSGGERDRISGVGDVVVRYKRRLTNDGARVQVGVIPFVKLPTASRLGNGTLEGGLAVPVSIAAGTATITFGPEIDLLADGDGAGYHPALVNLVNVALPAAPRLTLIGELWTNFNLDPAGTLKQVSADAALAYAASNRLQFDVGANFGLTRDTPDVEISAGASLRF
jgi:opacity protein-like surface antigen